MSRLEKFAAALLVGCIFLLVAAGAVLRPAHGQTLAPIGDVPAVRPVDTFTLTGSSSGLATLLTVDTTGFHSISVQLAISATATVTYECSLDNLTWFSCIGTSSNGSSALIAQGTASQLWNSPVQSQYFRVRVSSYTSGTIAAVAQLRAADFVPNVMNVFAPNGIGQAAVSTTTSRLLSARVMSAATTNGTNVKATLGNLYGYQLCNTSAAAKYVKFYNKATAPTVGTDTPVVTIQIAAGACNLFMLSDIGTGFSLGLGYGITGAPADADTTPTAVNDVVGAIYFQ